MQEDSKFKSGTGASSREQVHVRVCQYFLTGEQCTSIYPCAAVWRPTARAPTQHRASWAVVGPVHSAYNPSFSTCFFSRNSIFLSQQISQQCFSAGLSAQPNGSVTYVLSPASQAPRMRCEEQPHAKHILLLRVTCELALLHLDLYIYRQVTSRLVLRSPWHPSVSAVFNSRCTSVRVYHDLYQKDIYLFSIYITSLDKYICIFCGFCLPSYFRACMMHYCSDPLVAWSWHRHGTTTPKHFKADPIRELWNYFLDLSLTLM
jgi:hypothetical protein